MRKIFTLLLSLILVLSLFTGAACSNNKDSGNSSNNSSNQSSTPPQQPVVEIIDRDSVATTVESNVNKISLMDTYLLTKGNNQIVKKAFNGVVLGDFISELLNEVIMVGYGSDGNWYMTADQYNPTKFNAVTNAIFNYQIGSNKPLGLSDVELTLYGEQKLINVFGTQFGMYNLDSMIMQMLPATSAPFIQRMLGMKVNDLYAISNGDYTYFEEFIAQTHPDEIINLVFDLASLNGVQLPQTQATLVDLIDYDEYGLFLNDSVTVGAILDSLTEIATYAGIENADAMFEDIAEVLGRDTEIAEVVDIIIELEFDVVVDDIANALKQAYPEDSALIDEIFATIKAKADGTIGEIIISEQNVSVWFDDIIEVIEPENEYVARALGYVKDLYADVTIENILQDSLAFHVDAVIDTIAEIFKVLISELRISDLNVDAVIDTIDDVADLLQLVFTGTIANPALSSGVRVDEIIVSLNDIVSHFAENEILAVTFDELEKLYADVAIQYITEATMSLDVDDVINSLFNVLYAVDYNESLVELEEVLCEAFSGTIENLEIDEEYYEENADKTLKELVGESVIKGIAEELFEVTLDDVLSLIQGEPSLNAISILSSITIGDLTVVEVKVEVNN